MKAIACGEKHMIDMMTRQALMEITADLVVRCRQRRTAQENYLEAAQAEREAADAIDTKIAVLRDLLR